MNDFQPRLEISGVRAPCTRLPGYRDLEGVGLTESETPGGVTPSDYAQYGRIGGGQKSVLYLGFFGEGPKWDNFPRLGAYPSGFSYLRPFRYQDKRIDPKVLADLGRAHSDSSLFTDRDAVICVRFRGAEYKRTVLPIRKAVVRHVDRQGGDNAVYFTLGPYVNFTDATSLDERALTLNEDLGNEIILFESEVSLAAEAFSTEDQEFSAWSRYCDLVGKDDHFPIRPEAKGSVYFKFRSLRTSRSFLSKSKAVGASKLYVSDQEGPRFGASLKEGKSYELVYHHRIPSLIDSDKAYRTFALKPEPSTTNVELHRVSEEISGNYEPHTLEISGVTPTGTYEELDFKPESTEFSTTDGGNRLFTVPATLPLKVKSYWLYRLRTRWLPGMFLIVLLIASTLFQTIYEATVKNRDVDLVELLAPGTLVALAAGLIMLMQAPKR